MTDNLQIFREFDKVVRNQYDTIPLQDIDDIKIGDENSVTFFSRIVRSKQNLKPFPYSDFKIYDELLFISRDIKYYTALLFYFKPYITDSSYDGTYHQTLEDRRYMMFASICFQSVYNFWDRIGDLLALFFETGLHNNSIYFSRVLNNFPKVYKQSNNFQWLRSHYDQEIKNFLGQRDDIVHSYQLECKYYWEVIEAKMDVNKTRKIQKDKESFPDKFERQIDLILKGFVTSLRLIEELPDKAEPTKSNINN
jgi:hypothetical protein